MFTVATLLSILVQAKCTLGNKQKISNCFTFWTNSTNYRTNCLIPKPSFLTVSKLGVDEGATFLRVIQSEQQRRGLTIPS